MRLKLRIVIACLALVAGASAAQAGKGTTTADLALRAAPSSNTERLATIPAGSTVQIGQCRGSWCAVAWNRYSGYAAKSGLAIDVASRTVRGPIVTPDGGELWPIYPPYPYRAGHYPKADWYHKMPPYVAMAPSFYRKRYFMVAQERNRYRYVPHVFRGSGYDDDGSGIANVDIQGISASVKNTYGE